MTSERMEGARIASRWQDRASGMLGWALAAAVFSVAAIEARGETAAPFAKVGDVVITQQDYDGAFARAARSKFYHGKPPEAEVAALQREVGQTLIDDVLLAKEARRRKIAPDLKAIQQTVDGYDRQYASSEQWQKNRVSMIPKLKARLEQESVLENLRKAVRNVPAPTDKQLEQYWEAHKDKFTEPEQIHLSMILLKVDPSSPQAKWDGAKEEGGAIFKRLAGGADFAQLAQLHSGDASAQKGGDMGYLHRGMLPEPAQVAIDKLKAGEISAPVVLLEGVAVFRLEERKLANLNPLAKVRQRAQDLWQRDKGDEAWTQLLARLHKDTPVKMDESRFLPLAAANGAADKSVKAVSR